MCLCDGVRSKDKRCHTSSFYFLINRSKQPARLCTLVPLDIHHAEKHPRHGLNASFFFLLFWGNRLPVLESGTPADCDDWQRHCQIFDLLLHTHNTREKKEHNVCDDEAYWWGWWVASPMHCHCSRPRCQNITANVRCRIAVWPLHCCVETSVTRCRGGGATAPHLCAKLPLCQAGSVEASEGGCCPRPCPTRVCR